MGDPSLCRLDIGNESKDVISKLQTNYEMIKREIPLGKGLKCRVNLVHSVL